MATRAAASPLDVGGGGGGGFPWSSYFQTPRPHPFQRLSTSCLRKACVYSGGRHRFVKNSTRGHVHAITLRKKNLKKVCTHWNHFNHRIDHRHYPNVFSTRRKSLGMSKFALLRMQERRGLNREAVFIFRRIRTFRCSLTSRRRELIFSVSHSSAAPRRKFVYRGGNCASSHFNDKIRRRSCSLKRGKAPNSSQRQWLERFLKL